VRDDHSAPVAYADAERTNIETVNNRVRAATGNVAKPLIIGVAVLAETDRVDVAEP
jgi:hypothetical protein